VRLKCLVGELTPDKMMLQDASYGLRMLRIASKSVTSGSSQIGVPHAQPERQKTVGGILRNRIAYKQAVLPALVLARCKG